MNQTRQPKGTPIGGQFSTGMKSELNDALTDAAEGTEVEFDRLSRDPHADPNRLTHLRLQLVDRYRADAEVKTIAELETATPPREDVPSEKLRAEIEDEMWMDRLVWCANFSERWPHTHLDYTQIPGNQLEKFGTYGIDLAFSNDNELMDITARELQQPDSHETGLRLRMCYAESQRRWEKAGAPVTPTIYRQAESSIGF